MPIAIFKCLFQVWPLFLILLVFAVFKLPIVRGRLGELSVNIAARIFLDKNQYHLIKDVTLVTDAGTTQIDHIIVSRYGIFVIETKNFSGWVFGGESDTTWTQNIYGKKHKFQNPLRQNYKHTKTLEKILNFPSEKILSLIVFVGDSKFKTPMPDNVTHCQGFVNFIKSKTAILLTDLEVESALIAIEERRLARSFQTNRNHVRHLRSIHKSEKRQSEFGDFIASVLWKVLTPSSLPKRILQFSFLAIAFVFTALFLMHTVENIFSSLKPVAINQPIRTTAESKIPNQKKPEPIPQKVTNIVSPPTQQEQKEPQYTYLIELESGRSFKADSGYERDGVITFKDKNGLVMSVRRAEVKHVTQIQL